MLVYDFDKSNKDSLLVVEDSSGTIIWPIQKKKILILKTSDT